MSQQVDTLFWRALLDLTVLFHAVLSELVLRWIPVIRPVFLSKR